MASTRTYTTFGQQTFKTGNRTNLDGVLVGKEVDDLKCMCNNTDCHELLAIVAALHHQAAEL